MANNFRQEQDIVSQKTALKTTGFPLDASIVFGPLTKKLLTRSFHPPDIKFFKSPYLGVKKALPPKILQLVEGDNTLSAHPSSGT